MICYGKLIFKDPPDRVDPSWWRKTVITELEKKTKNGLRADEGNGQDGFFFSFTLVKDKELFTVYVISYGKSETIIDWENGDRNRKYWVDDDDEIGDWDEDEGDIAEVDCFTDDDWSAFFDGLRRIPT